MLLALDMGNTNIKIGVFKGDKLLMESRLATNYNKTEDQYAIQLLDILRLYGVDNKGFEGAVMSSVVPPLTNTISRAIEKVTGVTPMIVGPGIKTGIDIRIDNPAQLALTCWSARSRRLRNTGSLHNMGPRHSDHRIGGGRREALPRQRDYGGVGVSIRRWSARVPAAGNQPQPAVCCGNQHNRVHAVRGGIRTASMIDGMSDRITEELGCEAAVVYHRRAGAGIASCCRRKVIYDDNLLLNGLRIVYNKNKK